MYIGRPSVLCALLVLSLFGEISLSRGENIYRRQDGNVVATTSNNKPSPSADSQAPSQTSASRAATNTVSNSPSPTENSQSSGPPSSTSRGKNADGTTKNSPAPTMAEGGDNLSSNSTSGFFFFLTIYYRGYGFVVVGIIVTNLLISDPADQIYQGGLPINPIITPGIAVAGVFLLLAGIPYCLIGIKIKL